MTDEDLWKEYCSASDVPEEKPHQAWAFGGDPDGLVNLVLQGKKAATASLHVLYSLSDDEPLPKEGDLSVVLDSRDRARCIIMTTRVYLKPFLEVSSDHAFKEGEGDRTLDYWRQVHVDFFSDCLKEYGMAFSEEMLVVCEEFQVVWRKKDKVLVSACLLGDDCKYSGGNNLNQELVDYLADKDVVPVCPEVMGGLSIPRKPAEIVSGIVSTKDGTVVDREFRLGARLALEKALIEDVDYAVLQPRSPSCGVKEIYDGTFSGHRISDSGVFATLLKANGIPAFEWDDLRENI